MIIKSVMRGGYRSAAEYMKEQGKNEKTRLVELSDPSARTLDDAFHNMWVVASGTRCKKPLHHISINPARDERLTDEQLMKIVEHCEEVFGYKMFHHQRVIVEHVRDGRQHFHVIWNRVSLVTGRPVWPGKDWPKAKQICRDMEKTLGLKSPTPRKRGYNGKNRARNSKTSFCKNRRDRSHSTRSVKHRYGVKQGRSHMSPYSNASVVTMLNRIGNHSPKRKTTGTSFNGHGNRDNSNVGTNFFMACLPPPLALPKIILFKPTARTEEPKSVAFQPVRPSEGGWPPAAIHDWKDWGHKEPRRFFAKWPELAR